MRKQTQKTKYAIQVATVAVVFALLSPVARASEITPNNIINYVNIARESQGLSDLVVNPKLMQVAQDKLSDMIANQYFAHTSPSGVTPWTWFEKENYDYHYAGENLAINFTTAENEQAAWMASPTHRKNILDANYQEIGVAVGTENIDGRNSIVAVQEFGATFAGLPDGGKNSTPFKNSPVKTNNGQIIPQVLSAKSMSPDQAVSGVGQNGGQTVSMNWFGQSKLSIINQAFLVAMVLVVLSMALAAAAFLALALDRMWAIVEIEKRKKELLRSI